MKRQLINEVNQFKKIAGLLKENYNADRDPEVLYKVKDLVKSVVRRFGKSSIAIGSSEWNELVSSLEALFQRLGKKVDTSEFYGNTLLNILQDLQVDINHGDLDEWHPDDSSHVDLDDINDEDPEDMDDLSEDDYTIPNDATDGDTEEMGGINEKEEIKRFKEIAGVHSQDDGPEDDDEEEREKRARGIEDADTDAENAERDIDEDLEGEYEKQLAAADQTVAGGTKIADASMYGKITPDKFVSYFKGEGRNKKYVYYYIEPGEEVGAMPITVEQAAGLIKSLISGGPIPKGLPAGYAWRLYAI